MAIVARIDAEMAVARGHELGGAHGAGVDRSRGQGSTAGRFWRVSSKNCSSSAQKNFDRGGVIERERGGLNRSRDNEPICLPNSVSHAEDRR